MCPSSGRGGGGGLCVQAGSRVWGLKEGSQIVVLPDMASCCDALDCLQMLMTCLVQMGVARLWVLRDCGFCKTVGVVRLWVL
jgi:hypothetical protein